MSFKATRKMPRTHWKCFDEHDTSNGLVEDTPVGQGKEPSLGQFRVGCPGHCWARPSFLHEPTRHPFQNKNLKQHQLF